MPIHKRPFHFLLLAILFGGFSGYCITVYPPTFVLPLHGLSIPLFPFVALGLAVTLFFFFSYLFHSILQGILLTFFLFLYLLIRYVGLTNIFFLLLLIALLGSLEVFFFKKK